MNKYYVPKFLIILFLLIGCSLNNSEIQIKSGSNDRNKDGKPDIWVYQLDKDTILVEFDQNYDGKPDSCDKEIKGSKVIFETDIGCDGSVEAFSEEYDGNDMVYMDTNRDGIFDFKGYSKNNIPQKVELDLNYDGKMDAFKIFINGKLSYCEIDADHDGIIDKTIDRQNEFMNWMENTHPEYTINFNTLNEQIKNHN